jgi:hypothetical protein
MESRTEEAISRQEPLPQEPGQINEQDKTSGSQCKVDETTTHLPYHTYDPHQQQYTDNRADNKKEYWLHDPFPLWLILILRFRHWQNCLVAGHDEGDGVSAGMREADGELLQTQLLSPFLGPAVKPNQGLSARIGQDFHLPPFHATQSGSQSLGHCLLGCEAGGQLRYMPPAIVEFRRGINILEEAVPPTLQRPGDALGLDQVYAYT